MPSPFPVTAQHDIMARALPWLVEERTEDGTRFVRRCAEMHGGCGATCEVPVADTRRRGPSLFGFSAWYREHCQCGLTETTFAKRKGHYGY